MHLSSRVYRKSRVLVAATLVISALATGPALAKGPRHRGTGNEKCYITPNPVSNDGLEMYSIVGSGFIPGVQIGVIINGGLILMGVTDSYGNFAVSDYVMALVDGTDTAFVGYAGTSTFVACCSVSVL